MTATFDPLGCPLDGINLIEASAGTGKTFNICLLYLRLLLERKLSVQQILVVTFTIAATAELRERIRARLVEALSHAQNDLSSLTQRSVQRNAPSLAPRDTENHPQPGRGVGPADSPAVADASDPFIARLLDAMVQQHGYTPKQIADRLDLALQTFDEASIFTIHGFCQRALADTAFTAGRPFEFELVTDDHEIIVEAVNDFWRRRIAGETFPPALASYLKSKYDSPESYAKLVARHLAKPLARRVWPPALDQARSATVDIAALEFAYASARDAWQTEREHVLAHLTQHLHALNGSSYNAQSLQKAVLAWDRYFLGSNPLAAPDDKASLLCATNVRERTKKGHRTPTHAFCDRVDELLALQAAARDELARERLRLLRTLIDEVGADLPRRKRERRVIAFNDMLSNLHDALRDKRYAWLSRSLRERFPAALIDEFQDTDPLQFAIFDAIYGEGHATLFLVGDPKQAIYSFRNADLYTYLDARKRTTGQYTLSANQRSTPGLIKAVNGLFGANARAFMLEDLHYQAFEAGQRGREPLTDRSQLATNRQAANDDVRLHVVPAKAGTQRRPDSDPAEKADLLVWTLPIPLLHRSAVRERAVQATAAEIARLLTAATAGRILIGDQRLRPKDIAILVRSHAQGSDLKRALAKLNIGSVELLQESIFASIDAAEVERVLMAINEPSRVALLRSALATEMIGDDAADIVALSADEARLSARIEQFAAYREAWTRSGVGVMFRQLLTDEGASARLLSRPDGERRLTNLLHLGEELHKAAQLHDSPEALLRWLQSQRRNATNAEATQLRLESDQNLVQIATIHKAKGLEWPIVFCPFLWDGFLMPRRTVMDSREYHDDDGAAVIDFRAKTELPPGEEDEIRARQKLEDSAELLRLAYVALTRAIYRCYLVAGPYGTHNNRANMSTSEGCGSLLNWLVAGNGLSHEQWFQGKRTPEDIVAAWHTLAGAHHPHIQLAPLPDAPGTPVELDRPAADSLVALTPPARIANAWRMSSFSALANGAVNETAASDHDARSASVARIIGAPPPSIAPDDILRFPRGSNAGDCLHAVFERIDFTDPSTWNDAIARALAAYPQPLPDARGSNPPNVSAKVALAAMIARMLADVTSTKLPFGSPLASVPLPKRLTELEFSVCAADVSATQLNRLLAQSGYTVPRLAYGSLEGYVKGFIDLVFEHDGRFWILDWKSNHLGYTADDYSREAMEAAMVEHGYHLQHLIYALALDRYLAHRMAGYDYERHFGGVLYLFIRGVRPQWTNADGTPTGIYAHRPARATLQQIDRLLRQRAREASA